jgi:hypothetical protein
MFTIMRVPEKGKAGTPVSMNATFNGSPYKVDFLDGFSICAAIDETTPSLAGTLKLQVSNNAFLDNVNNETNASATWVDYPSSTVTLTAGNTQVLWNVSYVYFEAVRIVWTRTSGQGTITPYFVAKGSA